MIVSDSHRFICFQPWKVASSTLSARLGKYDSGRYPAAVHFNEYLAKIIHKHIALDDFVKLPESHEPYYRFTFIRNPYDRIYSGFLQRRWRLSTNPNHLQKNPRLAVELESIKRGFGPFLDYCNERYKQECKLVGRHLHEYVYHEGRLMVDFIGFQETFEQSFAQVCAEIGIDNIEKVNANLRFKDRAQLDADPISSATYTYIKEFDAGSARPIGDSDRRYGAPA